MRRKSKKEQHIEAALIVKGLDVKGLDLFDIEKTGKERADRIRHLHDEIEVHMIEVIPRGIEIGKLLTIQKEKCGYGNWMPWVRKNLPFTQEWASFYMRMWDRREELEHCSTLIECRNLMKGSSRRPSKGSMWATGEKDEDGIIHNPGPGPEEQLETKLKNVVKFVETGFVDSTLKLSEWEKLQPDKEEYLPVVKQLKELTHAVEGIYDIPEGKLITDIVEKEVEVEKVRYQSQTRHVLDHGVEGYGEEDPTYRHRLDDALISALLTDMSNLIKDLEDQSDVIHEHLNADKKKRLFKQMKKLVEICDGVMNGVESMTVATRKTPPQKPPKKMPPEEKPLRPPRKKRRRPSVR